MLQSVHPQRRLCSSASLCLSGGLISQSAITSRGQCCGHQILMVVTDRGRCELLMAARRRRDAVWIRSPLTRAAWIRPTGRIYGLRMGSPWGSPHFMSYLENAFDVCL